VIDAASPAFLCIGDIDVDILIGVDRLPTHDGKVNGEHVQRVPGGMAGNVSVALARLGARVRVLGRVGDDEEGTFALTALAKAGVDTDFVPRLAGVRTFSCIALITPDGEKSLIKLMTSAYRPSADQMTAEVGAGVGHIHLTSVGDPALCRRVVEISRAGGATTSLDVERADCPSDPAAIEAAIQGFDLVFCNAEARALLDERLRGRLGSLAPTVVTTLGEAGARVETGALSIASPGFPADAVDTTGAGDCFAAACLHARLSQRLDWPEALRFANRAAALSTQGLGAQSALPTLSEVRAALSA
jgi:sugar/nucleoside kinase (ribokinase family)